jgi:hypothetical protein
MTGGPGTRHEQVARAAQSSPFQSPEHEIVENEGDRPRSVVSGISGIRLLVPGILAAGQPSRAGWLGDLRALIVADLVSALATQQHMVKEEYGLV